ncbi:inositol monophosphatase family protein [Ectobacillus sp. JY-23]|uniref:inositol monophosphatase family protein n=1 Tax=Ectobacillus sp. JY-23 TaxID=2933872 RepID=UPI001FF3A0A5|nr:inositol monophosphatase family protein [Ectobacillus sp. JY-23]UOY93777.1 inositol monophosphatase family protein [Ectobacillus sp. JY-23]
MDWNEVALHAKQWMLEAGGLLRDSLETSLTIETKSNASDLVTNMDRHIEQFLIGKILEQYPLHRILGEEGYGNEEGSLQGTLWLIDPIDGTMNFVHQKRNFVISIGIYHNGQGKIGLVYDPVHDEMYSAVQGQGAYCNDIEIPKLKAGIVEESVIGINATWLTRNRMLDYERMGELVRRSRGSRSYGCAALEMVYVATGRLDGYITPRLSPWDFGGGAVILSEVGGIVTNFNGAVLSPIEKGPVLAAKPGVYEELLTYVK